MSSVAELVHDRTVVSAPRGHEGPRRHSFLIVLAGPQFGEIFDLEPGRDHVIGRSVAADVHVRDDAVSRRHARVALTGEGARVVDLGSSNGVYVEGLRVAEHLLRHGDRFQIGAHTTLKFVSSDDVEAESQRRLAESVLYEPLTGLLSRRAFMARLSSELDSSRRHGHPVAVLMLDVDHFKRVNDTHGHLAGDAALQTIAQALREVTRAEDAVARYGGEEFVILARNTDLVAARQLAERVRRRVERACCRYRDVEISATVSIGFAALGGDAGLEGECPEDRLLEAADAALLQAKARGRNRIEAAPPLGV
jgi:diguanylate cyclase (GGDEF)-like protein